jgi:hypothetical protein
MQHQPLQIHRNDRRSQQQSNPGLEVTCDENRQTITRSGRGLFEEEFAEGTADRGLGYQRDDREEEGCGEGFEAVAVGGEDEVGDAEGGED